MKLYTVPATPFGRTVEVVAHELGIHGDIEIVATVVAPNKANADYQAINPLRRIPSLVADDGTLITDSALICAFLADHAGDSQIFGKHDSARWALLNDYMIAKGAADCLVAARYEGFVRPEDKRWPAWIEDMLGKTHAALARFEAAPPKVDGGLTIASISLAVLLGYLDFRFPDENWRARYPNLATWVEPINARPSFQKTKPA